MSIQPFSAPPLPRGSERRRARLVLMIAAVGISAMLLAYAVSPGVRHAVGHAAHSVKHVVSHVFDPDSTAHPGARTHARSTPARATHARRSPAGAHRGAARTSKKHARAGA
jgi:hypothetical protein